MAAFIQKGRATLVGGTATVLAFLPSGAIPTATRSTPGGVAGTGGYALPSANQTTSQFVINAVDLAGALVATDTSTVNWIAL